ncbi:hypothetical protein Tco_0085594 [Tanacetum coccineum]
MSKHKEIYTTPSHTKKVFANMKREGKGFSGRDTPLFPTMMVQAQQEEGEADEAANEEHIPTPSYDPPQSGEDRLQLNELMEILKKLEKKKKSRTHGLRRLYKVGRSRRVESSKERLGGKKEVILIDETQGRNDEDLMFDTGFLNGDEVFEEPMVNDVTTTSSIPVNVVDPVTTAGEVVTTASATTTTVDELTLAQTLIEIKAAKPKAVTTASNIQLQL